MNIEFEYRYRDWGNFKRYGTVVFQNQHSLTCEEVRQRVLGALTDGQFFDAAHLGIPELFFSDSPFDPDLDHGQHEFCSASETELPANDVPHRDINDFLLKMGTSAVTYR
jgi:hypothetical protein